MKLRSISTIVLAICASAIGQTGDAPPVDVNQLLQGLKQFKEQSDAGIKTRRNAAYQQIIAAAASNERASLFWTEAVLAVQFAGVGHETTAVREWKTGDGEALRSKEGANAARLHLLWLGLTIQHAAGAETKQLLPNVIDFTRQIEADELAMERVEDQIDKAKERAGGMKKAPVSVKKGVAEETHAKKVHDNIMRMSVGSSPVARRLQIADLLGDTGGRRKKNDDGEGASWESVPGNMNGIYNAIILPEFRATRDPRILEYWDMTIKKEQHRIEPGMADYDERQWMQVRQPQLLWSRAQDVFLIGQRNRAVTEMFNLIKAYPQHPDLASWISRLESLLAPTPAVQSNPGGAVSPPTTIPPATAPATVVPTARIVPAPPAGTAPVPR